MSLKVCRICLEMNKKYFSIFNHVVNDHYVSDMLTELAAIEVKTGDLLPLYICSICLETLIFSWKFRQRIIESDIKLRSILIKRSRTKPDITCHDTTVKEEVTIEKTEIYESLVQDTTNKFVTDVSNKPTEQENVTLIRTDYVNIAVHSEIADCNNEKWLQVNCVENFDSNADIKVTKQIQKAIGEKETVKPQTVLKVSSDENSLIISNFEKQNLNRFATTNTEFHTEKDDQKNKEQSVSINLLNCSHYNGNKDCIPAKTISIISVLNDGTLSRPTTTETIEKLPLRQDSVESSNNENVLNTTDNDESLHKPVDNVIAENSNSSETQPPVIIGFRKLTREEKSNLNIFCKICNKSFRYHYFFEVHVRHHKGDTPFKCNVCGKGFVKKYYLKLHKTCHSNERPFPCEICGKSFKHPSILRNHKKIHSDIKPYECNLCGKSFRLKYTCEVHLWRHKNEKKYVCEICGKSFTDTSSLSSHRYTHVADKKYPCPTCGKTFVNNRRMKSHLKRHSPEKPYQCNHCGRCFKDKTVMENHALIHTGEKPHSCNICGKSFRQKVCLPHHMRMHTGETPYACKICPSQFKSKQQLNNHVKKHK